MQSLVKKLRFLGFALLMLLLTVGVTGPAKTVKAELKTGFQTINGESYYINDDGTKQKGWLTLDGKKYYFDTVTGVQVKGWMTDSKGQKRYFTSVAGVMATGWLTDTKGQKRYFDPETGIMQTKWMTLDGKKYYFYSKSGVAATGFLQDTKGNTRYFYSQSCAMATGWLTNSKGQKRYFDENTGVMATGFATMDDHTYYFYSKSGVMATGWLTNSQGQKRYFDTETGYMATGKKVIDGKEYEFNKNGVLQEDYDTGVNVQTPGTQKTIRNYLLGALQPVGRALYVWGGGWTDSTRKGVSPTWTQWYTSQDSSYDYNDYRDLSVGNRVKGLDCSGFVGWAAYQVMQTQSGVGSGYTVVSGDIGSSYKSRGWGKILTQADLAASDYTLKPGDVGYNDGHTWIVLGQCADKSLVIVHSTPQAGCQISGTPTPSGSYLSSAIRLAKEYMSQYAGYTKYDYHPSSGNYIRNGNYFRWNRTTLADPDGYMKKNAAQILEDLFGY